MRDGFLVFLIRTKTGIFLVVGVGVDFLMSIGVSIIMKIMIIW